jgi:hypothetical protein
MFILSLLLLTILKFNSLLLAHPHHSRAAVCEALAFKYRNIKYLLVLIPNSFNLSGVVHSRQTVTRGFSVSCMCGPPAILLLCSSDIVTSYLVIGFFVLGSLY